MEILPARKATIVSLENIQILFLTTPQCEVSLGVAVSLLKPHMIIGLSSTKRQLEM